VHGGRYGPQEIERRALGPPAVEFQVPRGEEATVVGSVNVKSADVILHGGHKLDVDEPDRLTILGTRNAEPALDIGRDWSRHSAPDVKRVTVEDVHSRNLYVEAAASAVDFRMGELGPSTLAGPNLCGDLVVTGRTDRLQVTDSSIHDNRGDGCGSAHIDALDLNVTNAVIAGNRIWWCGTQCVFTGDPGSGLLEDNMIEETSACGGGCDGPQEVALMGTWTVRWNTIEGDEGYGREPDRPGHMTIEHNLFLTSHGACDDASGRVTARYDANVFAPPLASRCGDATACTPTFSDGRSYDGADRRADYTLAVNDDCARRHAGAGQHGPPSPAAG
jgi:hypothetical protein